MIGLVIVAHSRALAMDVVALARQMASPDVQFAIAAGVGEGHRELGTDTAEIAQAIETVFSPDGVLVLMDLGSAVLGAETALDLLPNEMRERVRLCPAPLVEGALAAAVQASLGASLDAACQEASEALQPKYEYLATSSDVRHLEGVGHLDQPGVRHLDIMVTLENPHGLHARPAARFVQTAAQFDAAVSVQKVAADGSPVGVAASARSVNQLAMLGGQRGDRLRVSADGPQAREALAALRELVESRFGETDAESAPGSDSQAEPSGPIQPSDGTGLSMRAIPVSEGIAIGVAVHLRPQLPHVDDDTVVDVLVEQRKLDGAIERARRDIELRRKRISAGVGEDRAAIFDAHLLILDDEMLAGQARQTIRERHASAAQAWRRAVEDVANAYRALPDAYLRQRAADVIDVGAQVLAQLGQVNPAGPSPLPKDRAILIAHDFGPTQIAQLDLNNVAGLVSVGGSTDSHAAILVRALGVPAVAGADASIEATPDGVTVAIDGSEGRIWINPSPSLLENLIARRTAWLDRRRALREASQAVTVTRDGARIEVAANLGSVVDAQAAMANGAEAVGVLRTEFLYLTRENAPTEDEQLEALTRIAQTMQSRPVIVRTLDVGGDKFIPYLKMAPEANPFLGVRAIRLSFQTREVFLTQVRAILRAGAEHDVRVLLPMISLVEEIEQAQALLEAAHQSLRVEGLAHRWPISLGAMVETPSAALLADALAARVDFLSIGTNDLTQYTLAAERGNPNLAGFADALHPAVLKLIKMVAEAATQRGKWSGVCGEIAADPVAVPVLIGLGVNELSLNPAGIPQVKSVARAWSMTEARRLADEALRLETARAVRELVARHAAQMSDTSKVSDI